MVYSRYSRILLAATFLAGSAAHAGPWQVSQQPPAKSHAMDGNPRDLDQVDPFLVACINALAQGKLSQGEEDCTLALVVNPKDSDALGLRGYGFLLDQRFDRAEEDFRAALQLVPDNAADLAGYGQSLTGLGHFDEAVPQFEKAVALMPGNPAYRIGLCWARAASGKNLDVAMDNCNAAMVAAPGMAGPLNSRGLVNLRLGRFSEAIADYTASLAVRSAQPSAYFGRGLAHLALGEAATGRADILAARTGDAEIDSLFVQMGTLPNDCGVRLNPKCPEGFPPLANREWVVAGWHFWP